MNFIKKAVAAFFDFLQGRLAQVVERSDRIGQVRGSNERFSLYFAE